MKRAILFSLLFGALASAYAEEEFSYTVPYPLLGHFGVSANSAPEVMAVNVGVNKYFFEPTNVYLDLQAMGHRPLHKIFWGFGAGFQLCIPRRISPFIGGGIFIGQTDIDFSAETDGIDNNKDGTTDEPGEELERGTHLSSAYPEVGFHYWLTELNRVTFSGRYFVTDKGKDNNFWAYHLQFSRVFDW